MPIAPASHCNTLQHTATHCNTLQHTGRGPFNRTKSTIQIWERLLHLECHFCNTLQHSATLHDTATHCNTLQHTATHCNTLQHTANTLEGAPSIERNQRFRFESACCAWSVISATHYNTLQHTTHHYNTLQHTAFVSLSFESTNTHCNILQHTATLCNTLQPCDTLRHNTTHKWPSKCNKLYFHSKKKRAVKFKKGHAHWNLVRETLYIKFTKPKS